VPHHLDFGQDGKDYLSRFQSFLFAFSSNYFCWFQLKYG